MRLTIYRSPKYGTSLQLVEIGSEERIFVKKMTFRIKKKKKLEKKKIVSRVASHTSCSLALPL